MTYTQAIHVCFETQGRRDQKFETRESVERQKEYHQGRV